MKTQLFTEIWKDIPGYIGLYQASNFGRVKSIKSIKKPSFNKGYLRVQLWKNGKSKHYSVHRLVWITFNGSIPDGYEVNHINEIKTDNSLWNLNLITHIENNNWGTRKQRVNNKLRNGKRSKKVRQCDLNTGELIKIWSSTRECGRNGFHQGNVAACCRGEKLQYKSFKWEWLETC